MATFILVHGAWHGGWVWQRVQPLLEGDGHRVLTPTLRGLGDRAALATPATGLEDHVGDLVDSIGSTHGERTYLVAHSYAGVPATVAADRAPGAVAGLIYLDARVPTHGQRGFDVWPGTEEPFRQVSRIAGHGWLVPPPDDTFGISSPSDLAWVRSLLTPQPIRTYEDRVLLSGRPGVIRAGAIVCVQPDTDERVPVADGMPHLDIAAGHDAMVSDPVELVRALLSLVATI